MPELIDEILWNRRQLQKWFCLLKLSPHDHFPQKLVPAKVSCCWVMHDSLILDTPHLFILWCLRGWKRYLVLVVFWYSPFWYCCILFCRQMIKDKVKFVHHDLPSTADQVLDKWWTPLWDRDEWVCVKLDREIDGRYSYANNIHY